MLLDLTFGTNDLVRAARFYDAIFELLECPRLPDGPEGWIRWRLVPETEIGLWLCTPFDGAPASAGNGTMLTLRAETAAQVRAVHGAGLSYGGTDEGAPGIRPAYEPSFYVAYLRDPDGHKLACVHDRYDPRKDI